MYGKFGIVSFMDGKMSIEAFPQDGLGKAIPFTSGSFKLSIVIKMLRVLRENGQVKRTNLAGEVGLNYKQCIRYANVLFLFDWAHFGSGSDIRITDKGIKMIDRLENF